MTINQYIGFFIFELIFTSCAVWFFDYDLSIAWKILLPLVATIIVVLLMISIELMGGTR